MLCFHRNTSRNSPRVRRVAAMYQGKVRTQNKTTPVPNASRGANSLARPETTPVQHHGKKRQHEPYGTFRENRARRQCPPR